MHTSAQSAWAQPDAAQVLALTMVLANGTAHVFTPEADPFLMKARQLGSCVLTQPLVCLRALEAAGTAGALWGLGAKPSCITCWLTSRLHMAPAGWHSRYSCQARLQGGGQVATLAACGIIILFKLRIVRTQPVRPAPSKIAPAAQRCWQHTLRQFVSGML
jgi:hypothetical protein